MTNISVKSVGKIFDPTVSTKTNVQPEVNTESFDETLNGMRTEKTEKNSKFESVDVKDHRDVRNDKLKTVNRKELVKPEDEVTDEQIAAVSEEVISQIKETLMDKYNISEEQLEFTIESIGLDDVDLLNATELTQVVMSLEGIENQADMLTNPEFAKNLKEILAEFEDIKANVKPEDFKVEQLVQDEIGVEPKEEMVNDVSKTVEEVVEERVLQNGVEDKNTADNDINTTETIQTTESTTLEVNTQTKEDGSGSMMKQDDKKNETITKEQSGNINLQSQDFVQKLTEDLSAKVGEVKANDIVRQVVEQTQLQVKQGVTSLEMQLYPEHLGKVLVQVVSNEGTITAQITAESEAAKTALESQLTLLKENLNNQGVKVENVEVTIASHAFEQNMQGETNGEHSSSQSKRSRRNTDIFFGENGEEEVEVIDQSIMELKGSTVSYSA